MSLTAIKLLVQNEIDQANQLLLDSLDSDIPLIIELSKHLINSGGKRLRPLSVILSAKALGCPSNNFITLAVVIEFIHAATLLHDDVVDHSSLRRGKQTANAIWGNEATVLVGDYLYSRSFQMMVKLDNMSVMSILANASNTISEGEVLQLLNCHNPQTSESAYYQVVENKTAKLFEAGCECAALLADTDTEQRQNIATFGKHLGLAFQLIDDALDYTGNRETLGKNKGDDLAEGKPTLPLIYALQHGTAAQQTFIKTILSQNSNSKEDTSNEADDKINEIIEILDSVKAIEYTYKVAEEHAQAALQCLTSLPDSDYKQALIDLTHFTISRNH